MNLLLDNQPTLFNDLFYNYFKTYKRLIKFYTSNKILYNIFIKNNKFEEYFFTPKSYEELKTVVNEWCDNREKALIKYGNIKSWNTTYITNMKVLFNDKQNFNEDIIDWNVSNVENMSYMFHSAISFNQELNNWNVSNVKDMSGMFRYATNFNQPLNNWNVSNITNMSCMFYNASSFNQPLNNWDVSNVENMSYMFKNNLLTTYPEWYKE